LNHGDTDDSEIVSGDEGDLTPIEDISEFNDIGSEPVVDIVASEGKIVAQQPHEAHADWQPQVINEAPIIVETLSETVEPQKVKDQPSNWQRIRGLFSGGADVGGRLNSLTQAIEDAPESAVNYVLRAELYMSVHEYALAQADFQRAIDLAETQFELDDWGLLDQAMRDRAIAGMEKVQRRLR